MPTKQLCDLVWPLRLSAFYSSSIHRGYFLYLIRYFHHLILHFLILSTFRANDSLIRCLRPPYNVQQKEV